MKKLVRYKRYKVGQMRCSLCLKDKAMGRLALQGQVIYPCDACLSQLKREVAAIPEVKK